MLDRVLRAIADTHRREMLRLVIDEERSSGEIASHFSMTRPAVSQHLHVLIEAGLVSVRRQGTWRYYQARPEGLVNVRILLEEFWGSGLERLKVAAEQEDRERTQRRDLPSR